MYSGRYELKLIFRDSAHFFEPMMEENECPGPSLLPLGEPLIVRNIRIATEALEINAIMIQEKFRSVIKLVHDNFPQIDIQEYDGEDTMGSEVDVLILNITHKTLHEEINGTQISANASVLKTNIIHGPCIIEDDDTGTDHFGAVVGNNCAVGVCNNSPWQKPPPQYLGGYV